jgi:hypothetical protein
VLPCQMHVRLRYTFKTVDVGEELALSSRPVSAHSCVRPHQRDFFLLNDVFDKLLVRYTNRNDVSDYPRVHQSENVLILFQGQGHVLVTKLEDKALTIMHHRDEPFKSRYQVLCISKDVVDLIRLASQEFAFRRSVPSLIKFTLPSDQIVLPFLSKPIQPLLTTLSSNHLIPEAAFWCAIRAVVALLAALRRLLRPTRSGLSFNRELLSSLALGVE